MKAICVDDEILLAEHTAALCRRMPILDGAESFTSAQDALDWLGGNKADIAILDIDMPDMSGIELAARMQQIWPDIRIIFLTGYPEFEENLLSVKAAGYLLKPVRREVLSAQITRALEGKA